MLKKLRLLILFTMISVLLTGCGNSQIGIFEKKEDKNAIKVYSKDTLEDKTYYVKDGTKFYPVYYPEKNKTSSISNMDKVDKSQLMWFTADRQKIPTLYKNEVLAYCSSEETTLPELHLSRFKVLEETMGFTGAYFTEGMIAVPISNICLETTMGNAFQEPRSDVIMIEKINNENVNENMLTDAGTIKGLESGKEYTISYYDGTYNSSANISADVEVLQMYELYTLKDTGITQNGYIKIQMNDDMESGYYYIGGAGVFKYYNYEKKDADKNTDTDMNKAFYKNEEEQLEAYSQQYTFSLDSKKHNIMVKLIYEETTIAVRAMLTAPDKKTYKLQPLEGEPNTMSCSLAEAIAGDWIVNISPISLTIKDVKVVSAESNENAIKETFPLEVLTDMESVTITAQYEVINPDSKLSITGSIILDDGKTYDFEQTQQGTLTCTINYIPKGNYHVNIYHYDNVKVNGIDYSSKNGKNTETVTVTG